MNEVRPNYVINKNPMGYGNNQEYFLREGSSVVREAVNMVKQGVETGQNLQDVFLDISGKFRQKRGEIAINTETENAEEFLLERDSEAGLKKGHGCTILWPIYSEYGDKMCASLQSILSGMPHDLKKFDKTTFSEESTYCGRKSSFELEIIDTDAMYKKMWYRPADEDELERICDQVQGGRKEKMKHLKKTNPTLYTQDKMSRSVGYMAVNIPSTQENGEINYDNRKSHWVLATSRCEIDGKMPALSLYLTYMYADYDIDPVKRMTGRSKVLIIHQDAFLIEGTLKECSKLFEKAIRWNSQAEELSALKETVGLFRYFYAHAMSDFRGCAAKGEWFQDTQYNYHGYTALWTAPDKACDLEALTARSLGVFMAAYNENTRLEKL